MLGHHQHLCDGLDGQGGVYDNMGLQTARNRCRFLFGSHARGTLSAEPDRARDWAQHVLGVTQVLDPNVERAPVFCYFGGVA